MLNIDALQQLKSLKKDIKDSKEIVQGIVKGSNNRFGFVTLSDGKDIYLSPDEMLKVFPGDEVEIDVQKDPKGKEFGLIEKLVKSNLKQFVGKYVIKGKAHFVDVDVAGMSRWIFIPPNKRGKAQEHDLLHCQVLQHPIKNGKPQAEILNVIGSIEKPGIEREYVICKHQIENDWNNETLAQTNSLTEQTIVDQQLGRQDLRNLSFVTIDAASTTDMDDALFVETTENGWKLKVAIADPTAVIAQGSALEQTAYNRMTSIYFPDEPLAMLPESISTQLCSLLPKVDRLALICEIEIDATGALGDYKIYEATIHSRAKLSYQEVAAFLETPNEDHSLKVDTAVASVLETLSTLANALKQWRADNALVSEDRPDYRLRLNEQKKIATIDVLEQNAAHAIVGECMIAANRCAADLLTRSNSAGLFITHAGIRSERQSNVLDVARSRWEDATPENLTEKDNYVKLVRLAQQDTALPPIKSIIAKQHERSLFSTAVKPHFGMGLDAYTTFTSPLRKGNDFYVHRLIKKIINAEPANIFTDSDLEQLQEQTFAARRAVNEMEQWLKCQYIEPQKDQTFKATVVRMTSAGCQVKINENGIEGFVSTKAMPVKYSFDPNLMTLTSKSKDQFMLDQEVDVLLDSIDWKRKQIQFKVAAKASSEATATDKAAD
ncbi:ribonuclease R family protein [Alkalimarinus alittae]|uniref:exoribonuclease II n=1 Tax=Alkalimarinus alittae TaxID=2961619 RepID=A0ABY6N2S3_9ALTE|nr:VacB/RNase II family 3'-5' exoribonuclease [Alkalimarinus alittae]UZE96403.1 VacB/RNase II family 3'-5' exoribonuclease [Alkalimarinus alittae]